MSEAFILCPGPTLVEDLAGLNRPTLSRFCNSSQVIAVNGAIRLNPGDVDFWAVQDIEVFSAAFDVMGDVNLMQLQFPTAIWTHSNFVHSCHNAKPAWHSGLINCVDGFRIREHKSILSGGLFLGIPWQIWSEFTFFTALALAVHSGADDVLVLGCSLSEGYFDARFCNERTQHHEGRWHREKCLFKTLIHPAIKQVGVNVDGVSAYGHRL